MSPIYEGAKGFGKNDSDKNEALLSSVILLAMPCLPGGDCAC